MQSPAGEAHRFSASPEIPRVLWKTKVHYQVDKCPHLSLSWARSIQAKPPIPIREDPFKHYPPIYAWVFQVVSIPQVSPPNPCLHLSSSHTCYMPCLSNSSRFNHPNNILWEVQLPQQTIRMFTHPNIHKQSWTSPDRKTHNQIDHILIERRLHSSVRDVRSSRGSWVWYWSLFGVSKSWGKICRK